MTAPARKLPAIRAKLAKLRHRREILAVKIEEELRRPAPCSFSLQSLKRQRLLLKDQIARYSAQSRGADVTQTSVQAL
ncbi:MAG: DUF465 domain-containing protein [Pseudooceanicola sp.]